MSYNLEKKINHISKNDIVKLFVTKCYYLRINKNI